MKIIRPKSNRTMRRIAPYTRRVRSQLPTVDMGNQRAFDRWLAATIKDSKHSKLSDLPSSQLPNQMTQVDPNRAQLFAVMDTCSIVKNTIEFMDCVTDLKRTFPSDSPIKFIISLTVLEELDKCNRPNKKPNNNHQYKTENQPSSLREQNQSVQADPPIEDLLYRQGPPRSFMRFIEEEVRVGRILIGQLDPFKSIKLPEFEIINKDDRILECCLRGTEFIQTQPHHEDTRLILVTEDNIFKTKATTFGIASFRWREFKAKYHNFGRNNCVQSPVAQPKLAEAASQCKLSTAALGLGGQPKSQIVNCNNIWDGDDADGGGGSLIETNEIETSGTELGRHSKSPDNDIRITQLRARKELVREFLRTNIASKTKPNASQEKDDIVILQEVITLDE